MSTYDIAVIGGGPGGYVAAIRASQLGLKVALVERDKLGGICLNWGCIPTKALLRSSEVFSLFNHAANYGLKANEAEFDFTKIIERSRKVSQQLSNGIAYLMKKNKITVIQGTGKLKSNSEITVLDSTGTPIEDVTAKNIIIATGARAKTIPGLEPDGEYIWDYRAALAPTEKPNSLLVVGSGAIGIEFASFYNTLGTKVHVVEIANRILPAEDSEISEIAKKSLQSRGINFQLSTSVANLTKENGKVTATLKKEDGSLETLEVDKVISAVGISPNVEGLGLEELGIATNRGHIETDQWCATNQPGVFAIGDVTAPPWLAHKASHEAVICVDKIAGKEDVKSLNTLALAGCTYCTPQVASVGYTESKAKEMGYDVKVGRFPFQANGKAIAMGETEGMIKTIVDRHTDRLLGAHMIGAEVTELIQGFSIALTLKATASQLSHVIFPHPTLSEMMHESILDTNNEALHF
ncbi:MAG: dihydrolipoyl dehydrogenase [Methyloligella sp.]|nr:MAG: dihydrolipoyl dehydrogenase [Methyloligella sp.]